jgi:ABC-type polysaccharide/polyol phosphate export permease
MLRRMLGSVFRHRRLVWQHAAAHLRHRYAGSGLGVVWNVLHPLAMIAVYSVVFTVVVKASAAVPGVSPAWGYVLYLCAGFLPWLALAECVTRGTTAFTDNAAYLKKLPVPEPVFVAQAAAAATLGLGISFALLVGLALVAGVRPTAWWLLVPVPLLAMQALGLGVGLLLGTLNAFFRDVAEVLGVALQVVFWTAPIVYPMTNVPGWLAAAMAWHPLVPALHATRELFLYGRFPAAATWVGVFAWPAVALLLATAVFNALRAEIRDVL